VKGTRKTYVMIPQNGPYAYLIVSRSSGPSFLISEVEVMIKIMMWDLEELRQLRLLIRE